MVKRKSNAVLSPLEEQVMDAVWRLGQATAEEIRTALQGRHDLTDSSVRTLLRRIEAKGVLEHSLEGRTFLYRPKVKASDMANQAVRSVIDRFCDGSIPSLLIGMADDQMISADELRQLAAEIELKEKQAKRQGR